MRVPSDLQIPLPELICARAEHRSDAILCRHVDGPSLSYAQFHERSLRWAAALERLGVGRDDLVVSVLPVTAEAWPAWIGLSWLGAVEVPTNPQLVGMMLDHVLAETRPVAVVTSASLAGNFRDVTALPPQSPIVVADGDDAPDLDHRVVTRSEFFDAPSEPTNRETVRPWDLACLLYTSGTTGPSKGVRVPWRMLMHGAMAAPDGALLEDDPYYFFWATYHAGGKYGLYIPALAGGMVVARDRLSISEFWRDVRHHGCRFATLTPTVAHRLMDVEPDDVAPHPLRGVWCAPITNEVVTFGRRFGVRIATTFGMTEIGIPIGTRGWDEAEPGTCGTVLDGQAGYEVRLVDGADETVPDGGPGELVIRARQPWSLNAGYHGQPGATAEAWRNGWFHTGDVFRRDAAGRYSFVDRLKDCIRSGGENISSFEVERFVMEHPDVAECAAIGVPSGHGDEDLMVIAVPREGAELAAEDMARFLDLRVPRFMRPRYVEIVDRLPRTPATLRVQKHELRARGVTEAAWDRHATPGRSNDQ